MIYLPQVSAVILIFSFLILHNTIRMKNKQETEYWKSVKNA